MAALNLEGELGQPVAQRVHGIVAQAGDPGAAAVGEGQGFQHIVHIGRIEIEPRRFARAERAGAFEETDAVFVEDHLFDRQIGREHRRGGQKQRKQNVFHDVSMRECPGGRFPFIRPSP